MAMSSPSPIGLVFPLRHGNQGYFQQSFTSNQQAQASLLNLLSTRIGERRLNPRFGCRAYNYIFEQDIDEAIVAAVIEEDVSLWIPSITVKNVNVSSSFQDIDQNLLYISVDYLANNITGSATVVIPIS